MKCVNMGGAFVLLGCRLVSQTCLEHVFGLKSSCNQLFHFMLRIKPSKMWLDLLWYFMMSCFRFHRVKCVQTSLLCVSYFLSHLPDHQHQSLTSFSPSNVSFLWINNFSSCSSHSSFISKSKSNSTEVDKMWVLTGRSVKAIPAEAERECQHFCFHTHQEDSDSVYMDSANLVIFIFLQNSPLKCHVHKKDSLLYPGQRNPAHMGGEPWFLRRNNEAKHLCGSKRKIVCRVEEEEEETPHSVPLFLR